MRQWTAHCIELSDQVDPLPEEGCAISRLDTRVQCGGEGGVYTAILGDRFALHRRMDREDLFQM